MEEGAAGRCSTSQPKKVRNAIIKDEQSSWVKRKEKILEDTLQERRFERIGEQVADVAVPPITENRGIHTANAVPQIMNEI